MAVQAQYPANAFSPDYRTRAPRNNVMEDIQVLQDRNFINAYAHLVNNNGNGNGGGTTALSNPQSELTCNATSSSRKRAREQQSTMTPLPIQIPIATAAEAAAYKNCNHQSRLLASAGTSTSGRTPVASSLAQGLLSNLYHQNFEVDALVRLQNERLRSGLAEARKRHCEALLTAVEQGTVKRLREKEAELEIARRKNIELEEKVKQMTAENQIWFNVAKNNEAIATSLRATLEQLLLQNNADSGARANHPEGFGDSDAGAADDAESCCFELGSKEDDEMRSRRACKVCRQRDVSVLLLPCRHLCLCKECESKVDTCPVCCSTKNACLQIFMA
ncbi:probable BOI-related E3 ubiquitin-protein ligase 2 [Typha latifolia]|uniref:probable BOI-related E3 ubiquitin-protein ligase 2 n=1 Tax=Typha latifolia TaxID=4733 RepID=UPI003C2B6F7A